MSTPDMTSKSDRTPGPVRGRKPGGAAPTGFTMISPDATDEEIQAFVNFLNGEPETKPGATTAVRRRAPRRAQ